MSSQQQHKSAARMLLLLHVAAALVTFGVCAPFASERADPYLQYDRDGRYIMRYETPDGIVHFETGYQRRTAEGIPYNVKEGYYIYPTSDGRKVRISYFADKDGFRIINFEIRADSDADATVSHVDADAQDMLDTLAA